MAGTRRRERHEMAVPFGQKCTFSRYAVQKKIEVRGEVEGKRMKKE